MADGKIFLLMGKSTSGKDTIYRNLIDDSELSLKKIIPYTTRPMREGERDGVQYFFKSDEEYKALRKEGKIIEERIYHTMRGDWIYFTADDAQADLENGNYLVIGTLESFCSIRDHFGEKSVVPIYIDVDAKIRLLRGMHREEKQEVPHYDEMCRRFLADEEDFSEDNLFKAGIDKRFFNNDKLEDCLDEIRAYIRDRIG